MYDSLDTMLLMGLHEEFAAALPIIEKGSFNQVCRPARWFPTFMSVLHTAMFPIPTPISHFSTRGGAPISTV